MTEQEWREYWRAFDVNHITYNLHVRPRWKRILRWPRLVWLYAAIDGIDLRTAIRLANMAVMFKGRWSGEPHAD